MLGHHQQRIYTGVYPVRPSVNSSSSSAMVILIPRTWNALAVDIYELSPDQSIVGDPAMAYPLIQEVWKDDGVYSVIHGTRVSVRAIVNYTRLGATPEEIVTDILPDLKLEQVKQALAYYKTHKETIDKDIAENTTAATKVWLQNNPSRA